MFPLLLSSFLSVASHSRVPPFPLYLYFSYSSLILFRLCLPVFINYLWRYLVLFLLVRIPSSSCFFMLLLAFSLFTPFHTLFTSLFLHPFIFLFFTHLLFTSYPLFLIPHNSVLLICSFLIVPSFYSFHTTQLFSLLIPHRSLLSSIQLFLHYSLLIIPLYSFSITSFFTGLISPYPLLLLPMVHTNLFYVP